MITQNDLQQISGADVYATDGDKIGSASQVYLDNQSGNPEWVSVKTGLFGTKESFVPLQDAKLNGDRIEVPTDKAKVKDAPRIDVDGDLSQAQEDELYAYYGLSSSGRYSTDRQSTDRQSTGRNSTGRSSMDDDDRGDTSGPTTDD